MRSKLKTGAVAVLATATLAATTLAGTAGAYAAGSAAPYTAAAKKPTPVGAAPKSERAFTRPTPEGQKRAVALADKTIAAQSAKLVKSEDDVFSLDKATSVGGAQYLTYNRTYRGVPVYGGGVVVATDGAGLKVATLETAQKTELNLDTKPSLSASKAASKARTLVAKVDSVSTPKLVVHALAETGAPRLAWEVVVSGSSKTAPSVQHVYVDAQNGSVLSNWDAVKAGTGQGFYNGNVTITTSSGYTMRDGTRSGLACGGQNGSAYTKSTDSWGNGQGTNLETACVDAYWAAQKEWDMLKEWFNYSGFNGRGGGFPARVGLNDVNAFWNGSYTNFGHNQANNQQATPMDVVGHEYGHAIYQFAGSGGGTGSGNEDGGLNESTGDIFGALLEAYANNPNDPPDYTVGEEVNLVGSGPIRYMYKPSQHSGDPDCYSSSIPNTEVHAAAGPQNHWFYLVAEGTNPGGGKPTSSVCSGPSSLTGIGIQKAGQIYLASLQLRTSASRTHAQARAQTLTAAKQQFPNSCVEWNAVKAAWTAVNVPAGSNEGTCTIQNPNDFSVSLNPTSGSVQAGQSATSTVGTTVTAGSAQSITLRASGLPSGANASFSPATITAGQSSTLTITTSSTTPNSTSSVTVTADGTDVDKTATYTLTVGGGGPGGGEVPDISVANVKAHLQQLQTIATNNGGNRRSTGAGYTQSVSYVETKLRDAGYTVSRQSCTSGCTGGAGPNLIADWPGGDANQVVMSGAHLDSVAAGPGINDNGSGSATLLEVALTLAAKKPTMTKHVRFGWWTDEEQGLLGSKFYVNSLSSTERSKIKVYYNYDMVGSTNAGYFINNINTAAATDLKAFYTKLNLQPEENVEGANRSDDASFRNAGIPTSGVAAGASATKTSAQATKWGGQANRAYDSCYHSACDTTSNINDTVLDRAADAAAYAIWKGAVGGDTPPPTDDYSVSVNPSSATVQPGGSASATLSTQTTSGSAQSVSLSASGAPSGVSVSFSPATITSGQSSSVSITTSAGTAAGTYTINLNGTGTSANRSASFTLTVGGTGGGRTFTNDTPFEINDGYQDSTDIDVALDGAAGSTFTVTADIQHSCSQDVRITLVQPNGTSRVLKYEAYEACTEYNGPVSFTVSNPSRLGNGTWSLVVGDYFQGDTGMVNSWSISF
ncbi:M28 family peptidase [Streptosporangium sp. NPDC051022]|uniref:M28 family peptidase n=1 Tax=Streptosporangium sp. NPDC051022 TaxID=3155752 RepID=UPI00342B9ACC